jgi:hypothetical protein
MKTVIENYEGVRLKAYDAQPNNKKVHDTTIGKLKLKGYTF